MGHNDLVANRLPADQPLVGRGAERRHLFTQLGDPSVRGLVLVGVAGIGKSRLARELAAEASETGHPVHFVRATASLRPLPFAAFAAVLEAHGMPSEPALAEFQAFTEALNTARTRPVLIVDDVPELDDRSRVLLDFLLDDGRTFLVMTARTGTGSPPAYPERAEVDLVKLEALEPPALAELATAIAGGPIEAASLSRIVTASEGNPLFLRELVVGAKETGSLERSVGMWTLVGPLSGATRLWSSFEHRVAATSDEERSVLELVGLGEPLALRLVEDLGGVEAADVLERRGLLRSERRGGVSFLRFEHPLVGEVVRANLTATRRLLHSRRLADAAERLGDPTVADPLRVATWRLDGGGEGQLETLVDGATAAFRALNYELCIRLALAAWHRWRAVDMALLAAECLDMTAQEAAVDALMTEAMPFARDDAERANLATVHASTVFRQTGDAVRTEAILTNAASQISDPAALRSLDAQRGTNALLGGDVRTCLAFAEPILAQGGDRAFVQASRDVATALSLSGRSEDAIRYADQCLATLTDLADAGQLLSAGVAIVAKAMALLEAGALTAAADTVAGAYALSVETRNTDGQAWFASVLGLIRLTEGRLETAAKLFREAAVVFARLGHDGERWGLGGLALAAGQLGDAASANEALAALERRGGSPFSMMDVSIERGRGWAAVASGDLVAAEAAFWAAANRGIELGQLSPACAALHDLLRIGGTTAPAERLQRLGSEVDGDLHSARLAFARAVVGGDAEEAAAAGAGFDACGAKLFAAEARMLEHRLASAAGHHRRSQEAAATARALLATCEGASTPMLLSQTGPTALSRRELEIALLASTGLASRDIAERLCLSPRTVENHLQRAYVKLGIRVRGELAGALGRAVGSAGIG